jgi:hypothetical protein
MIKQVSDKTVTFINENLIAEGMVASYVDITEESGVYKLKVKIGNEEPELYVTKDGKLLFIQGVVDTQPEDVSTNTEEGTKATADTCETLTKVEEPILEAFVVANCPYGLQMQRIMAEIVKNIPSLAANMRVEYIGAIVDNKITSMHGDVEAQENLRQICLREEQASKYWSYVDCYMQEGKSADCLTTAKIDGTKLNSCMTDTTKGIKYAQADFDLASQHSVTGSPTLFLNGKKVSEFDFGGRTAEAVKTIICCGAAETPDVCSQSLETSSSAVSFSKTYTNSDSASNAASCQ